MPGVNEKVLIVDDEPSVRTLLSLVIGNHAGYSVRMAEDGASALLSMEVEAPDILLTDVHMPGMTGLDLMAAVRTRYPSVRVIAMSGTYVGDGMPEGLTADAFYLKDGRNWPKLFQILEALRATPIPPAMTSSSNSSV